MRRTPSMGFTLIELLVVIAIIGILAAMTAVTLPRALEKAKLARTQGDFNEIKIAMASYYNAHNSFPPRYGYITKDSRGKVASEVRYHHLPYLAMIDHFNTDDLYDDWADSFDSDRNGKLTLLEFSPKGAQTGPDTFTFGGPLQVDGLFNGSANIPERMRPYAYIPINTKQMKRVAKYFWSRWDTDTDITNDFDPTRVPANWTSALRGVRFPPSKYDAYVLICAGPSGSTSGLLDDVPELEAMPDYDKNKYHLLGMRAYLLATRDLNDSGTADFDFISRTTKQEGQFNARLPDNTFGYGPLLFEFKA